LDKEPNIILYIIILQMCLQMLFFSEKFFVTKWWWWWWWWLRQKFFLFHQIAFCQNVSNCFNFFQMSFRTSKNNEKSLELHSWPLSNVGINVETFSENRFYRVGVNCSKFDCSKNSRMSHFLSAIHVKEIINI
jgi:hypothetical protein